MGSEAYEGGCLCGATRLRVTGPGSDRCYCHCRSCRLASGAPFVAWATFPAAGLEVLRGELAEVRSSERVVRTFCASCGTALTYRNAGTPETVDVALAVLDDASALAPEHHIWISEKLPWLVLGDALPQHAQWRR